MLQVDVCWCQIYANDLESQSEFNGFREWLHTFELYRGKKSGDVDDDDSRIVGKFKVGSHFLFQLLLHQVTLTVSCVYLTIFSMLMLNC